nr:hypothetical protein [Planctomycetota bacterium]
MLRRLSPTLCALVATLPLAAVEPAAPEPGVDVTIDNSLALDDELLLFQELPVVISSSRRETSVKWSATPVSVIDSNNIDQNQFATLPESFPFTLGMDALQIDRNRFAIGVRGLHDFYSDRVLSLVDGRPADNPIFGGPVFH